MVQNVAFTDPVGLAPPIRVLIVADRLGPAQEAGFIEPLRRWREAGAAAVRVVEEAALDALRGEAGDDGVRAFMELQFTQFRPTVVVLSRYAGREREILVGLADAYGLPLAYHLDEDLFDVPIALGAERYGRMHHPRRFLELFRLVEAADVVQVTTPELADVVRRRFPGKSVVVTAGVIGPPAALERPARAAEAREEIRIGIMGGSERGFDLELVVPALFAVLNRAPRARLHLIGGICATPAARDFGERAVRTAAAPFHADIRAKLATLDLDFAIVPVRNLPFNVGKAPADWADFAAVGVPVIVSTTQAHQTLAAAGALLLCPDEGWEATIEDLMGDAERRAALAAAAGQALAREYSSLRCERGILDLISLVSRPIALAS